jgi:hypothetical protein
VSWLGRAERKREPTYALQTWRNREEDGRRRESTETREENALGYLSNGRQRMLAEMASPPKISNRELVLI